MNSLHASDQLQGVVGEDEKSHLCGSNDIDMADLVKTGCASVSNSYHDDLQRINVGRSQTGKLSIKLLIHWCFMFGYCLVLCRYSYRT